MGLRKNKNIIYVRADKMGWGNKKIIELTVLLRVFSSFRFLNGNNKIEKLLYNEKLDTNIEPF